MSVLVEDLTKRDELAVVINCAGRGTRLGFPGPKPLMDLGNGDRPILNILQDIPENIDIYMHVLEEQMQLFGSFLSSYGNLGHKVSYLEQQTGFLYDYSGVPICKKDGTWVRASNGMATFVRHLGNLPKFFLVVGGPKLGVCFDDVLATAQMLDENDDIDVVVFARELSEADNSSDRKLWMNWQKSNDPGGRPKFGRVSAKNQEIYVHPWMEDKVFEESERNRWPALGGMYLVRSRAYAQKVESMLRAIELIEYIFKTEGPVGSVFEIAESRGMHDELEVFKRFYMESFSVDCLYKGSAVFLITARLLKGCGGYSEGLIFDTYLQQSSYIPSVKTESDRLKYLESVSRGELRKRNY